MEEILLRVPFASADEKLLVVAYWLYCDGIIKCLDNEDLNDPREVVAKVAKAIMEHGTIPETITRAKRHAISRRKKQWQTREQSKST